MEVGYVHNISHRLGDFAKEQRRAVVGVKYAVNAQLYPGVLEVKQGNPLFLLPDIRVTLEGEAVNVVFVAHVAFLELIIVVADDIVSYLQEDGEEGGLVVAVNHDGRLGGGKGKRREQTLWRSHQTE